MAPKNIAETVESYISSYFNDNIYELCDIEFVKEGPNWYLRIFADKEGGIAIDDCEIISRAVEAILDQKDPIEQAYILEVSSPGIDRPLKKAEDFEKYAGRIVDVKLYKPIDGEKEFQGKLTGLKNDEIIIEAEEGKKIVFKRADVAICRLAVIF